MKFNMQPKTRQMVSYAIMTIVLILAGIFIHKFLHKYSLHEIIEDLDNIPLKNKILALVFMAANYLFMTTYDFLGLRYLGKKLAAKKVVLASFLSYAFSNSVGLSILASGSLRYRYYASWGLSFSEITKMVIFTSATLWLGVLAAAGGALVLAPMIDMPDQLHMYFSLHALGVLLLMIAAAYYFMLVFVQKPFNLLGQTITLPSPMLGLTQIAAGAIEWVLAAAVLYVLIPAQVQIGFVQFVGIFMLAQTIGLVSNLPGGVVVFETVLLAFFPPAAIPAMIGSILVYRVTYYVLPLLVAACILGISEGYRQRQKFVSYLSYLNRIYIAVIPNLLSVIVFIIGAYMLLGGATPINPARFGFVENVLPLAVVETSHFFGSLTGVGLLIISRGLKLRIDLAYQLTLALLAAGTVFGLLKGAEVETALFAIAIAIAMIPAKGLFDRRSPFFDEVLTKEWLAAVFAIIAIFVWLGFFSYKHVEYRNDLWWTFTVNDEAPRFLRTMVGIFTFSLALLLYKFMLPSKRVQDDTNLSQDEILGIVKKSRDASSYLALLPDKKFLTGNKSSAFIMYGVEGRNFISMGDPVSATEDDDEIEELILNFRKLSRHHGCGAVFYEVGTENIPHYIDAGFRIYKIGEEARVLLDTFSVEGKHWATTRNNINKLEKDGCVMEIVPAERVEEILPRLKEISDDWLENKNTREKRFSLGCFDENYIKLMPVAVVRRGEEILAFANLWLSSGKNEISIDLMRYAEAAPKGVMEFLFVRLMLYAKETGYEYFNLGMAPLSGMDTHSFSPFWNRIAGALFNHGERFYNFKGLRSYKDKFNPQWKPKYIAVESFFALPSALRGVAALISGGTGGIFGK
ncbi:bifunctional lysylphosphatidylglycerol flippase/synthetase MprF [Seleniivibrio woodruffii]|nr:bifunctional lysylphosphatidylglycerol flippase/synthetase MprF [Seleniivibrio woodruffii]